MSPEPPPPHLSLIIPAFNERARLGASLDRIVRFLRAQPYASEIIVVDDGSLDGTAELVRGHFGKSAGIRVHQQPRNLGKGWAVRQGMLMGQGRYLFFTDADLSVPIESLPAFLAALEGGSDVVIGTRKSAGAVIEVHQPLYRELLGKMFTLLSNVILGLRVSDFTCGFKGFRREAAREIFSRQRLCGWSFDAEVLYLARLTGCRVLEIPVTWRDDRETRVRLWKDVFTSFLGLLKVRANHCLRRYG